MTLMNEHILNEKIEALETELKEAKKHIAYLEKVVQNFKKYFDCWPRFITQLGIKDDNSKQQEADRKGI